ncbi:sulfite exporter TauE/SafE family protein [uncultured Rhodospira sp.]|uniref:sulfite exporter TauE/SafE family protein n=1 Tax=uncultured Rhodospira sp. TaxID=1936189 RepID=UPI00261586EB|nr:sulfite exporter TauE/SafE family protein [uncultured Rhodospira sp.]
MDPQAELMDLLASGLAHCHVVIGDEGGLLASLALAGLAGGFTHCAGMCGPFVLAQVTARMEAIPAARMHEIHRLTGAALVPYHLGRMTTYAALGAALAGLAGVINRSGLLDWISAALLLLAAVLFVGYALPRLKVSVPGGARVEAWWSRHMGRAARPFMRDPSGWRGYGLGVLLGFIPCGLLYGALAAAASSGEVLTGALAMAIFGASTVPSLLVVGLVGGVAATRFRNAMAVAVPTLMLINAAVLTYLAVRLVA